jgi:hypothetical protein
MPAEGYPCHWSFCRWLAGENAIIERIADPRQAAIALAPFVAALQRIDPTGGPPPERTTLASACRSQSSKKSSPITNRLTTSLLGLHKRSFMQRKAGNTVYAVGALQKGVALLKPLAIRLRNADRLRPCLH